MDLRYKKTKLAKNKRRVNAIGRIKLKLEIQLQIAQFKSESKL